MVQEYYTLKYIDYKKLCHRIPNCIGHTLDDPITDESIITLKVTAEDHVHHWLESQGLVALSQGHDLIVAASQAHPVMKKRGL